MKSASGQCLCNPVNYSAIVLYHGKICHIQICNNSIYSGEEIIQLISFPNPIECLLCFTQPFWRLPSLKTVTFVKANLFFISPYFMDTRFPLIYLFSPIRQIAHLHPSLWQQQPWHSWLPEAKDFLRLNIWVPVANPRWMHPVCCTQRLQPPQSPSTGWSSRRGSGVVRVLLGLGGIKESVLFSVPTSEASACHSGCPWFISASSWLASK